MTELLRSTAGRSGGARFRFAVLTHATPSGRLRSSMSRSGGRLCWHALLDFVCVIPWRRDRFNKLKNRAAIIREQQRVLFGQHQDAVRQKEVTADEHAGRILEWAMNPRPEFFSGVSGEQVGDLQLHVAHRLIADRKSC